MAGAGGADICKSCQHPHVGPVAGTGTVFGAETAPPILAESGRGCQGEARQQGIDLKQLVKSLQRSGRFDDVVAGEGSVAAVRVDVRRYPSEFDVDAAGLVGERSAASSDVVY